MKRLLSSDGSISVDITTETLVRTAKPLRMQEFQVQMEHEAETEGVEEG